MIRRLVQGIAVAGAILLTVEKVDAQGIFSKPMEIGFDGALTFVTGDNSSTSLSIPISLVRVGFQLSDKVQLEPIFSLDYVKAGDDNATAYGIGTGLVWNFSADRTKTQWYARPWVAMAGVNGSGGVSDYQMQVGAGFGIRCPLTSTLSWRTEANVANWLKHGDNDAQTEFGISFGISLWTK